ncbi:hypothetical protein FA13DRAFT_1734308, partial [Coprinellus micaceus]
MYAILIIYDTCCVKLSTPIFCFSLFFFCTHHKSSTSLDALRMPEWAGVRLNSRTEQPKNGDR